LVLLKRKCILQKRSDGKPIYIAHFSGNSHPISSPSLGRVEGLVSQYGLAIVVIHHQRKEKSEDLLTRNNKGSEYGMDS
jgi:hypothetical protein